MKIERFIFGNKKEVFVEKNRFDGVWGNGAFKIKIKGSVYINIYQKMCILFIKELYYVT